MSSNGSKLQTQAAEIRRAFDESFATPYPYDQVAVEPMLAIEVGAQHFAVRAREISAVTVAKSAVIAIPSSVPELMGITGIRGLVVPVFSLAALLGVESDDRQSRWLLLCGDKQAPLALGFSLLERQVAVPVSDIYPQDAGTAARFAHGTARDGDRLLPIISISRIVAHIKTRGTSSAIK